MKPSSTSIRIMSRKKCGEGAEQLMIQKNPTPSVKHGGGSVMTASGTGTLVLFEREGLIVLENIRVFQSFDDFRHFE